MEAIPLTDITAASCATGFLRGWISRYGVPTRIITDQGRQFTSTLWREMLAILGISPTLTTTYHPQSNRMIERVHRTLKERLVSRSLGCSSSAWMVNLPLVLLGIRTTVREDAGCCPADVVFGSQLRLPGDLLVQSSISDDVSGFASDLRAAVSRLRPLLPVKRGPPVAGHVPAAFRWPLTFSYLSTPSEDR